MKGCVYIARLAEVKSDLVTLHGVTGGRAAAATAGVKEKLAALTGHDFTPARVGAGDDD